jgi:hypothetical protein
MPCWLLIHPPLLGPAVLAPLARELGARGHAVAVPDLRRHLDPAEGWALRWAAAVAPADVVLGFSGAGIALPVVAAAVGARTVIWLDAVVPGPGPEARWPDELRALVAPRVHDGRIDDWTTWWGPDAMAELVPDPGLRAAIEADGHRLPGDFYDVAVPVPASWPAAGAAYVQLSEAYDRDAAEARARGWPVSGRRNGSHLDLVTDPAAVAGLVTG